jgi:hypothetical protein
MTSAPKDKKPSVFIGSSAEGLDIAGYIQLGLEYYAECTIWHQGMFGLSGGTLASLLDAVDNFEYAILVLTPDDLIEKRSRVNRGPRDNVLFELGLFMGALGREQTFIVYCRDLPIDLPTDLAGVTAATYGSRTDNNLHAALGPVCLQIRSAIQRTQQRRSVAIDEKMADSMHAKIAELHEVIAMQSGNIRQILDAVTDARVVGPASISANKESIRYLEGIWTNPKIGSTAYAKVQGETMRFPYCYGGNERLTGEYYDWNLMNDYLFAKFRWFKNSGMNGYVHLKIVSKDRMVGGWWFADDVPEDVIIEQLPHLDGMMETEWIRQQGAIDMREWPEWALKYYRITAKEVESARRGPRHR